jgi:hypothetical protein
MKSLSFIPYSKRYVMFIEWDLFSLNIFYCSRRQKDKTQVKQLRQSSGIYYSIIPTNQILSTGYTTMRMK